MFKINDFVVIEVMNTAIVTKKCCFVCTTEPSNTYLSKLMYFKFQKL